MQHNITNVQTAGTIFLLAIAVMQMTFQVKIISSVFLIAGIYSTTNLNKLSSRNVFTITQQMHCIHQKNSEHHNFIGM